MRCFNHRNIDCVGFCKECAKGLCENCASESKAGLACKEGPCVRKVEVLAAYLDRVVYKPGVYSSAQILLGVSFVALSFVFLVEFSSKTMLFAGLAFLTIGCIMLFINARILLESRKKNNSEEGVFSQTFQSFQSASENRKKKAENKRED